MKTKWRAVVLLGSAVLIGSGNAEAQSAGSLEGTLWAGQFEDAGTFVVAVSADCARLQVRLIPRVDWKISGYHIDVVSDPALFPTNGPGNPKIGNFQWSASFPPTAEAKTVSVGRTEIIDPVVCDSSVDIAIHATMVQVDRWGGVVRKESAWGGPARSSGWEPGLNLPLPFFEFPGRSWDYYFEFVWQGTPPPTPTPTNTPAPTSTPTPTNPPVPTPTPTATNTPVP